MYVHGNFDIEHLELDRFNFKCTPIQWEDFKNTIHLKIEEINKVNSEIKDFHKKPSPIEFKEKWAKYMVYDCWPRFGPNDRGLDFPDEPTLRELVKTIEDKTGKRWYF